MSHVKAASGRLVRLQALRDRIDDAIDAERDRLARLSALDRAERLAERTTTHDDEPNQED